MNLISVFKRAFFWSFFFSISLAAEWNVSAGLLVWYPSEEVASIWADVITIGDNESSWEAPGLSFQWDTGVRLGIQRLSACNDVDTAFYWTWFQSSNRDGISAHANSRISPEFFAAFLSGNIPKSMKVTWKLFLNMFDSELGTSWECNCFSVRPFIGLKGGWIDQSILVHYNDLVIDGIPTTFNASEKLNNNFLGIGPSLGIHTLWKLWKPIALFGEFSLATLYGRWSCSDFYKNQVGQTPAVLTEDSILGALTLRGFVGLVWESGARLRARIGYETQIWMNQLRIATFQLQRLHNDLTIQGITLSCECSF